MRSARRKLAMYLKNGRLQSGLSQKDFAARLGYSRSQFVSNWERGLCTPPMSVMKKMLKICPISRDELFDLVLACEKEKISEKFHEVLFGKEKRID